jgi:hypothetical protein
METILFRHGTNLLLNLAQALELAIHLPGTLVVSLNIQLEGYIIMGEQNLTQDLYIVSDEKNEKNNPPDKDKYIINIDRP